MTGINISETIYDFRQCNAVKGGGRFDIFNTIRVLDDCHVHKLCDLYLKTGVEDCPELPHL